MNEADAGGTAIRYRCLACGVAFEDALAGVVACPRCQSIADHEQLSRGD
jgi:uncharacterized Zn finger protein (UPF0148 family)